MAKQALILTDQDYGLDNPAWTEILSDSNFAVWSHSVFDDKPLDAVSKAADILLLDLQDVTAERLQAVIDQAVAVSRSYGFATARVPMVAIIRPSMFLLENQVQHFADILQTPFTQDLIFNRLTSLMRLATMRREAERRSKTFKTFGVGLPVVPPPHELDRQLLLYIGSGMAFLPIQTALPEESETIAALTPSMAESYMEDRGFDALIVELSDYNEHLISFIEQLRRNPDYFSFPIILVCHKRAMEDGLAGLAFGANDIVSFPFSEQFFENRIELLVREERYRQQLKSIFSEARLLMPTDEVTRLYSEPFLKAHLNVLSEEPAHAAMTFVGIDMHFDIVQDGQQKIQISPALFARGARMIASLMRAEDMLARLDNGRLVAFLPDTDLFEARMALQRVRSIVQLTPLADEASGQGINISLDFSMHHCDTKVDDFDVVTILRDLFENPVTRF